MSSTGKASITRALFIEVTFFQTISEYGGEISGVV